MHYSLSVAWPSCSQRWDPELRTTRGYEELEEQHPIYIQSHPHRREVWKLHLIMIMRITVIVIWSVNNNGNNDKKTETLFSTQRLQNGTPSFLSARNVGEDVDEHSGLLSPGHARVVQCRDSRRESVCCSYLLALKFSVCVVAQFYGWPSQKSKLPNSVVWLSYLFIQQIWKKKIRRHSLNDIAIGSCITLQLQILCTNATIMYAAKRCLGEWLSASEITRIEA